MNLEKQPSSGFTLMELLVGLAVSLLLLGLLLSAHFQTVQVWTRIDANINRSRQVEILTQLLTADLSRAVTYAGIASISNDRIQDRDSQEEDPGSRPLHFLAVLPNEGATDVCAITYRCRFNERLGGYGIYRHVIDSDILAHRLVSQDGSQKWRASQAAAIFRLSERDDPGECVAAYIWNFQPMIITDTGGAPVTGAVTVSDGLMPQAVELSFLAAAVTPKRRQRVLDLERKYWNIPTSHFFQQAFNQSELLVSRYFNMPKGWKLRDPVPKAGGRLPRRRTERRTD